MCAVAAATLPTAFSSTPRECRPSTHRGLFGALERTFLGRWTHASEAFRTDTHTQSWEIHILIEETIYLLLFYRGIAALLNAKLFDLVFKFGSLLDHPFFFSNYIITDALGQWFLKWWSVRRSTELWSLVRDLKAIFDKCESLATLSVFNLLNVCSQLLASLRLRT